MTPGVGVRGLLFGDAGVAAELSDHATIQRMLDVEAALADAEASAGAIPQACVAPIRIAAKAELYDHAAISAEAARAGNVAIPLVRLLTERVASMDASAARYVHWGATSQDIVDTGLVLQLRAAVPIVIGHLERSARLAADHARRYDNAPMPGRTWLQHATPTTFGLKTAGWADALDRARTRLAAALDEALVLQFGGASGTLAALGSRALAISEALAERLRLRLPDLPWHAHRDRLAHLGCALGVATGTVGKIARDLLLLAQTEIGEAHEAPAEGRGGSSTMPHKRNPVSTSVALAAAVRAPGLVATLLAAMDQEHERGPGGWQAEWDTLPELILVTAGGARALADALDGLIVDPARMRANIDAAGDVVRAEAIVMALAEPLGRREAHEHVEAAVRRATAERRTLADILGEDPVVTQHLTRPEIGRRLSTDQYLGAAHVFVERVLARHPDTHDVTKKTDG